MSLTTETHPKPLMACWLIVFFLATVLPDAVLCDDSGETVKVNKGIESCTILVGFLFEHKIPDDAFSGDVLEYQVTSSELCDGPLPEWMEFDPKTNTFSGFAQAGQVDTKTIICVKAIGKKPKPDSPPSSAQVVFTATVDVGLTEAFSCPATDSVVLATVYVDMTLPSLEKPEILKVLNSVSEALDIPRENIRFTRLARRYSPIRNPVLFSGKGDGGDQEHQEHQGARIQFQVGCSGDRITEENRFVKFLMQKAPTGELSTIIGYPVMDWTVHKGFPRGNANAHGH